MTTEQIKELDAAYEQADLAFAPGPRLRSVSTAGEPPKPRKPKRRIPTEREMYESSVSAMKSIARDR